MSRQLIATIVRHGETSLNAQKLIQGHTDTPLSELGIKQAEILGKHLTEYKFCRAYTSDLCRARYTAQLILKHSKNAIDIVEDKRLRERGFGEMEGSHFQIFVNEAAQKGLKVDEHTPKGGETNAEVVKRARSFWEDLCAMASNNLTNEPVKVLIVTHGGWIAALIRDLFTQEEKYSVKNFPQSRISQIPGNTGLTQLCISPANDNMVNEKILIEFSKVYDTSHLN